MRVSARRSGSRRTPRNGLRLYDYAASANCYKVRLLLAQLDRPYERIPVDIFAGDTLDDDYAAKNPARTTPLLETDDGRFIPESAAILFYLAEGTPFLADDPFDRAQIVRWLVYEQTEVIPPIGGLRFRLHTERLNADDEDARQRLAIAHEVLALLHEHLAENEFFVGDTYTIADMAVYGYVHVAHEAGIDMQPHGNVRSWLERIRSQPRYMNDLAPYPPNSHAGASRSIYDA